MGMKWLCWAVVVVLWGLPTSGIFGAEKEEWFRVFNGENLSGWTFRNPDARQNWIVVEGVLHNQPTHNAGGMDIYTVEKFGDTLLHIEFKAPKGGNSSVYLQGRYEVQVADSYGQWQNYDILFRQALINEKGEVVKKARISVLHNGRKIIDNVEQHKVAGGALDANEGKTGPLMLRGGNSLLEYRNIFLHPLDANAAIFEEPLPLLPPIKPLQSKVYEPPKAKRGG